MVTSPTQRKMYADSPLNNHFSPQTGPYSTSDMVSYRTRSPRLDNGYGLGGNPVNYTPEMGENEGMAGFVSMRPRPSRPARPVRIPSQSGPHELGS